MGFATLSKLWAIFQNKYFVFFLKFLIHFFCSVYQLQLGTTYRSVSLQFCMVVGACCVGSLTPNLCFIQPSTQPISLAVRQAGRLLWLQNSSFLLFSLLFTSQTSFLTSYSLLSISLTLYLPLMGEYWK